jgi:hypothetical protein
LGEALAPALEQLDYRRLSRSLLAGLVMLASFPADGSYPGNAQPGSIAQGRVFG